MQFLLADRKILMFRHVEVPFSKFFFLEGKYMLFNMSSLDITHLQGYAMFMALASHGQGVGGQHALAAYSGRVADTSLANLCRANVTYMQRYNSWSVFNLDNVNGSSS
jgi:hypothetical protein